MTKIDYSKYIHILAGAAITGFSFAVFSNPNKIVGGGVTGVATVLYYAIHVPSGVTIALLNLLLLGISFKKIGGQFVKDTLIGSLALAFFSELFSCVPSLTNNLFLAAFFGAILFGIGAGMVLSAGGTTGGTDVLARLFQLYAPHLKIGTLVYIVDFCVILASLFIFEDMNLVLFGIMSILIQAGVTDHYIHKLNASKMLFIITEHGEALSAELLRKTNRGVTMLETRGAYTMNQYAMLLCVLKEKEIRQYEDCIREADPKAFVIYVESQQILGNGFRIYK